MKCSEMLSIIEKGKMPRTCIQTIECRLVYPTSNLCSGYSQRLLMKCHLEPLCFDGLESFVMVATHFKMTYGKKLIKQIKSKEQKTVTAAWYTQSYVPEELEGPRIRDLTL
ncbi:hypothetical protein EVAR_84129_1 [Eumeta japonica]|uniref:Uncharacterized protein n=1 Tax=Eumeta variegata TaxID=151549 RepID=A0A4C1UYW6_EUMVA|nr:hypothetical protein EVAR_84129_1 [Eumeta japonica]